FLYICTKIYTFSFTHSKPFFRPFRTPLVAVLPGTKKYTYESILPNRKKSVNAFSGFSRENSAILPGKSFPFFCINPTSAFFSWLSRVKSRPSLFNSQFIHKIKIYFPYTNLLYFLERRDFSVGNFQKRDTFIPYNVPDITDAEINEEVDTLRSGWLAK